ncbi:MAG: hypothetical protein AAB608_01375, partial [Patescibacteria group bacterium]
GDTVGVTGRGVGVTVGDTRDDTKIVGVISSFFCIGDTNGVLVGVTVTVAVGDTDIFGDTVGVTGRGVGVTVGDTVTPTTS